VSAFDQSAICRRPSWTTPKQTMHHGLYNILNSDNTVPGLTDYATAALVWGDP